MRAMISVLAAVLLATPGEPAAPSLSLPTPPGEPWRVIQGYGCGTHDGLDDFYALDLTPVTGPALGAPVRAAAPGMVFAWVEPSGTLIVDHGNGYATQYTHMEPFGRPERGQSVARGSVVGYVGERGAPGNPHLHFALLAGFSPAGREGRRTVPLAFGDGYALPDIGGCGQHQGTLLVASGRPRPYSRGTIELSARGEPIFCPTPRGLCMR